MFFETLFADLQNGELIELRRQPTKDKRFMRPSFHESVEEVEAIVEKIGKNEQAYFGIAPRSEKSGKKDSIKRVQVIWADLDDVAELPDVAIPPTIIVNSGHGFHMYWMLRNSIKPADAEELCKIAALSTGGDNVYDCSRIFRIPETWNSKANPPVQCEVVFINPQIAYSADDLRAGFKVNKRTVKLINQQDYDGFPSKSEHDWAVVSSLVKAKMSDDGIRMLMLHSPCGDKVRESPGHYLSVTLQNAREKSMVKDEDEGGEFGFEEKSNGYYINGQSGSKQVGSFVLDPLALVSGEDKAETLLCNLLLPRKEPEYIELPVNAFTNKERFLRIFNRMSVWWKGTDRDLAHLQEHLARKLAEKDIMTMKATSTMGFFDNYWVGTDVVISKDGLIKMDESPVRFLENGRKFTETQYELLSDEETGKLAADIFPLIAGMNRPTSVFPMLGWIMACPFKERLWLSHQVRFPILDLAGTRGSGKTATITLVLLPLMGVTGFTSHDSTTTLFVLMSILGSSNGIPVSLTEYRSDSKDGGKLSGRLRELYDHAVDSRGKADQTVVQYHLTAPLIIDGEDALEEAALKERIVQVKMLPESVNPKGEYARVFRQLRELPINKVSAHYIRYTLGVNPRYKEAYNLVLEAFGDIPIQSERVIGNFAMVALGHLHLNDWLTSLGIEVEPLTPEAFLENTIESLMSVIDKSGRTALLVDEFVADVCNHIAQREIRFIADYFPQQRAVGIQLSTAYTWWLEQRRKQGLAVLTKQAIRAQLEERVINMDHPVEGQYVLSTNTPESVQGKQCRLVMISLEAAIQAGLDVPKDMSPELTIRL